MREKSNEAPQVKLSLPTLSVIMPSYNHARYLDLALQEVINQSTPPLEVIVVDDGSTDDSPAVVERLAAQYSTIRLVCHSVNLGVAAAMNRGLREAKGSYICFPAADDRVGPEFAALSLAILAEHPTAGFCFSNPAELLGDTDIVRRFSLFLSDRPCMLSPREIERLLAHNFFSFSSNTIIYRREALLQVGGFVEEMRWYTDWFANYVLAFRHGACYVPEVLGLFRVSKNSYSACGTRQAASQRAILYRMLDLLKNEDFRDVAGCFRRAAIVPEMRARSLRWLVACRRHRRHVTPRLCVRLLFSELWWQVMPYTPPKLRYMARWILGRSTRPSLIR